MIVARQPAPEAWRLALSRSVIFGRLAPDLLSMLAAEARERQMTSGEHLFRRGDDGGSMMAILAGDVRISIGSVDGREHVLRRLGAGEVFGEIAVIDGRPRTADAAAETNGRLLVFERSSLQACMTRDPRLAVSLLGMLCDRLRSTSLHLEALLFYNTASRLAQVLLTLVAPRPAGSVDITQSALGNMVGATRESINKCLRDWEKRGWVALRPGRVTVRDTAALSLLLPETLGVS